MPNEEAIRQIAYKLWELAGKPEGMDLDIWLEAERRYKVLHPTLHYFEVRNTPYDFHRCN